MKILLCCVLFFFSCKGEKRPIKNPLGKTVQERFSPPEGCTRVEVKEGSFAQYLRSLPLKKDSSLVILYDNTPKDNQSVHEAVVELPIGKKDLHQCADAVMRLRAEYLYRTKQYDKIHFNFTNGFTCAYSRWRNGERIGVKGNKTWWKKSKQPSDSYETFWAYMEQIFLFAGTYSLDKELQSVKDEPLEIGDIFIQGGFPGHALIVIDKAVDTTTKDIYFMLAQSYMPAQEIHILKNRVDPKTSPWYKEFALDYLETPEWDFEWSERKRFKK